MNIQILFCKCIYLHALLAVVMFAVNASAKADVVVVVSANSPVTRLTADQTAKIFLGKVDHFPTEGIAIPIDQTEGSPIRDEFYSKVVRKSASQLSAYWAKVVFAGNEGHPPNRLEGDEAVKNAIAKNPKAIGYIEKSAVDGSVKVIFTP